MHDYDLSWNQWVDCEIYGTDKDARIRKIWKYS